MNDSAPDIQRAKVNLSHEEYIRLRVQTAIKITNSARRGEIGLLLAACKINSILHELSEIKRRVREEDFLLLTGVDS